MGKLDKIEVQSLKSQVLQEIKQYILDKGMTEGDRLPTERAFTEMYGVSRSVVREALSYLEHTGVIETVQGRGTVIKAPDISSLVEGFLFSFQVANGSKNDLLSLRIIFECAAIEEIVKLDKDISDLKAIVNEDVINHYENDKAFHQTLLSATGNVLFEQLSSVIQSYFYHIEEEGKEINYIQTNEMHKKIIEAIVNKDVQLAKELMATHLSI
ncbi:MULTISPECIES: FadR/GntR family transcriptional regulator [Mammaliicoccus]|uniref:GntR family transcriptional regulator n=1 Tax=Mammaliicoccus sciuri TaxID=1296 RepID=A0AAW5LHC5_MAMSC|nr:MULTISPECIES: GntR family transcriptional regulator [Mammaliicoccus]MBG9210622.1 FadR family transcriptional regulator [Mammaliicoccus sciuri]MCD5141835.1 FadR family transcriptional regulator [Mammaliicoccus sciuri]MCI8455846.1 FadR family transcriptional regulator [Mammaliicoccus sciuri]MCQ9304435.1 GntR family transcriptional regulator [Mammaliicoccus sciuri]MDT0702372.1 GntR family transcriptional regulator [Mammaliicoccus sciuri]